MKYCVNSYSFGSYGAPDKLGVYGMIDKAAECGFDGIEFTESEWCNTSADELAKIGSCVKEKGLETVSFCIGADFLYGSDENLDREIERVCRLVDKAKLLGASKMRHDVAYGFRGRKYGIGYADALPRLAEGCRRVTEYAETVGVMTMTENHGYFSQDADRVASLIDRVAHPNFGVLLDLGNFMCADEDPTLSVSRLAPYAFHVHAKDFLYKSAMEQNPGAEWFRTRAGNYLRGTVVGHGDAKIYQSIGILKRTGYDGWLSLEFEGSEDNLKGIRLGLENLKRFWETC